MSAGILYVMATYKVPQDVEADDKLIGPFSFRQFIYLIIVALSGFIAWALGQIFIGLAIIPLPVIIFFGALALPLRKDQPMEIYMAAIVSFYLKPRKRIWDPEGIESTINISAPKNTEENRTKNLSEMEAEKRLGYLANIVDSGGWAIHGANTDPNSAMISDVFYDAQNAPDILDENNTIAQSFSYLMDQHAEKSREQTISKMKQALNEKAASSNPTPDLTSVETLPPVLPHDKVIQPLGDTGRANAPSPIMAEVAQMNRPATPANPYMPPQEITPTAPTTSNITQGAGNKTTSSTSDTPVSADIINLAKNSDGLSISTLSKQANRLKSKSKTDDDEVVISLR